MKQTPYHKSIHRDKGVFNGKSFLISTDSINWIHLHALAITEHGQLYSSDESDNHYLLLQSLQSCYVQIFPNLNAANNQQQQARPTRRIIKKSSTLDNVGANELDEPPVIFIKTYENDKLYIKVPSKNNFGNLISTLLVWQALKPQGLVKKWYSDNKVEYSNASLEPHELLVCRFKVYGPIPSKSKNLNIVSGPKAPVYQPKIDPSQLEFLNGDNVVGSQFGGTNDNISEGWFYTMGVLKSNGILNFITELDGTLLYSIDIKSILSSEIREMHHSLFNSSNVLFIGQLKELRFNNVIKTSSTLSIDQHTTPFLVREGKLIPNNLRVLIEFPLHIDLEDWFVGLNYFAKREYIGSYSPHLNANTSMNSTSSGTSLPVHNIAPLQPPKLCNFNRDNFRVSKKVAIDIIEAKFDNMQPLSSKLPQGKIYTEVRMWGLPWSRTAIVNHTSNPFWKEEFATDLPILTQMIHILIKKCSFSDSSYLPNDKVIGTVYVTPDILTKQLSTASTMMSGAAGNGINVNGVNTHNANNISISTLNNGNTGINHPTGSNVTKNFNNDIVRLSIYDSSNLPIGKLLLNVKLKEYHILSPNHFKPLEKMLTNAPMKDLIKFCNENVPTSDFEYVSLIMLDIFQSLGVEDQWFKSLMEAELVNVDKMTRKNYANKRNSEITRASSSLNNVFNTLFRGSSIFSKSLEKYNLRIGQEYLEKVFGDFFAKIAAEKKNCEVDPRYVRIQEKLLRKGKSLDSPEEDDDDDDSNSDSDGYDSDVERERDQKIKSMVEENFNNLYEYAEEIWHKIYITSNDLPLQIKIQLKNFRTKVELACDPDDKTTALNCLSAFIFLRFFCPAILNPKLFYLTKNHQTGSTQRTLTLIAKILLNLANRQEFSPHKEPHLVKMNEFLNKHQQEVFDYFDKITGRKNDFNEKILDLSHEVKRFDLGLSGDSTSNELPTTPYLIDKYLRLTELIHLLDYNKYQMYYSPKSSVQPSPQNEAVGSRDSHGDSLQINDEKNVYQIGSLEFEKSEFLDLAGDNETEGFLKSLCRSNENIFSFITSNITLKDLQKQSTKLMTKISDLEVYLENCEYPSNYLPYNYQHTTSINNTKLILKSYLDVSRNCLVFLDKDFVPNSGYRKLVDANAFSGLKLKFANDVAGVGAKNTNGSSATVNGTTAGTTSSMSLSFSNGSLGSVVKTTSKNPFKKWMRKNN
ncbi:GTPase-activating protein [Suhomyces tanzawaensis NRRL Y-17324]|uniref:GTPase-activating protein n=1 Tax=Suhomyces tanzawaensis NRRL Y-17324 TaxID=984487 RepID=A0A1E4SQ04_9ASCO|nr:GTPase-activating protein [Suhomyces tanzawaensis NRRL Y-17324]ODV81590.1 GTPase-activating protein [Suhomyces tanzawaensis NRRL Y-17324]